MDSGHESPQVRSTILSSLFLHGRPLRNPSQSHIPTTNDGRDNSPPPPQPPSPGGIMSGHRRSRAPPTATAVRPSTSQPPTTTTNTSTTTAPAPSRGLSLMLRRRRSANNVASQAAHPPAIPSQPTSTITATTTTTTSPQTAAATTGTLPPSQPVAASISCNNNTTSPNNPNSTSGTPATTNNTPSGPSTHRIRLVPHIDSRRTLRFDAIARDLKQGDPALRIGRFTDRSGLGLAAVNALGTNRLAFKSKVVSRSHAEIWVDTTGKFLIKDTKSSSGTFLNHVRLSPANTESRPFQMKDGDILQLGVDYQGGEQDIYKSVKIRVEIGREWQAGANAFNTNTLKVLRSLAIGPTLPTQGLAPSAGKSPAIAAAAAAGTSKSQIPDCCICLFSVTIRQALFIAPCSHTFHYKCIRPLLETHHPSFSCPLCRTFADLEEDVEVEVEYNYNEDDEIGVLSGAENVEACTDSPIPGASGAPGDGDDESVGAGGGDHDGRGTPAEGNEHVAQRRLSGANDGGPGAAGISDREEDVVYVDYAMGDASGGGESEGSAGSGGENATSRRHGGGIENNASSPGHGDSPALGLGHVAEVDEMDIDDGTVSGKRKR